MVGHGGRQILTTQREGLRAVAVGEEPEMPDLDEAWWQDVEKETANKFHRLEGHNLDAFAVLGVPPLEADMILSEAHQPTIGDGNPVGVAGQILQ
jgi:hypothetical protein